MSYKDRAKQRAKALAAGDRFKLKEDENFIRVLPTPESEDGAEDDTFYELGMHSNVGPEGKGFLRCGYSVPERLEDESCYICDKYIPRLTSQGHTEAVKKIKPRNQAIFQVLALDADNKYTGPHFWMVGGKVSQSIISLLGAGKRDITDPKRGYTFSITRTGSGLDTTYTAPILDEDPSAIPQKYVDMLKPFVALTETPVYSEQAQKDAIRGVKSDAASSPSSPSRRAGVLDEDDDDPKPKLVRRAAVAEDDEPAPRPKKPVVVEEDDEPRPKSRRAPVEDEDDEPVATKPKTKKPVVVEEGDEDEPPPTPKAKVKVSKTVEPEDEDEPAPTPKALGKRQAALEFDEDEDEAPAPKPKGKTKVVVEEDEDEAPAPKAKAKAKAEPEPAPKAKAKTKPAPVEEDDDDPFGDD